MATSATRSPYKRAVSKSPDGIADSSASVGQGEILAHLYDDDGRTCADHLNRKLIGLNLKELGNVEHSIGVAATHSKVSAMLAALRGGLINGLVSDEDTVASVLEQAE